MSQSAQEHISQPQTIFSTLNDVFGYQVSAPIRNRSFAI